MAAKSARGFKFFRVRVPDIKGVADAVWREYIADAVGSWCGQAQAPQDDEEEDEWWMMVCSDRMQSVVATRLRLAPRTKIPLLPRQMLLGDITCSAYRDGDYTAFFDTEEGMQREVYDLRF